MPTASLAKLESLVIKDLFFQENNRENKLEVVNVQRMTSLEIAEVAGKQHCDVVRPIRKMEEAWKEVTQGNFSLSTYQEGYTKDGACMGKVHGRKFALMFREMKIGNSAVRRAPCYQLIKTECLYIATKFNDEARARLVLRWQERIQQVAHLLPLM